MTKRMIASLFALLLLASLSGCSQPPKPIQAETKITGTVTKVYEQSVLLHCEEVEGYPDQTDFHVFLNAEDPGSYTSPSVGDLVSVYFSGEIAEIYPLEIDHVKTIVLVAPAPTETEPAREWSEEALTSLFLAANEKAFDWFTVHNAVPFPDQAYGRVGAVLYSDGESKNIWAAFPDAQGVAPKVGFPDMTCTESSLTYLGDGTIGFQLENGAGERVSYEVSISIDGSGVDFTVKSELADR